MLSSSSNSEENHLKCKIFYTLCYSASIIQFNYHSRKYIKVRGGSSKRNFVLICKGKRFFLLPKWYIPFAFWGRITAETYSPLGLLTPILLFLPTSTKIAQKSLLKCMRAVMEAWTASLHYQDPLQSDNNYVNIAP